MNTSIKTLTPEAILEFAKEQCPQVAHLEKTGDSYNPFIFKTARGTLILAPAYIFGNRLGFRSFLKVTGKKPQFLCNGQASSYTKCLVFFGEQGPQLKFRDSAIEPQSVWGIQRDEAPELISQLAEQNSPGDAVHFIVTHFPPGFRRNTALASVMSIEDIPVTEGVELILSHLGGLDGLPALRLKYKAKAPLLCALQTKGITISKCLYQWRNCEYPQSIASELLLAGFSQEESESLIKTAYAKSESFPLGRFHQAVYSALGQ